MVNSAVRRPNVRRGRWCVFMGIGEVAFDEEFLEVIIVSQAPVGVHHKQDGVALVLEFVDG